MSPIEAYIQQQPEALQPILKQTYQLLKELLPTAEEKISYGMPTFKGSENIIHFAAMKHHLGIYPTPGPIAALGEELAAYQTSKGAIKLSYDQPLPVDLLRQIVALRLAELAEK